MVSTEGKEVKILNKVEPQKYRSLGSFLDEIRTQIENREYLQFQRKKLLEHGDRSIAHKPTKLRQKEFKGAADTPR